MIKAKPRQNYLGLRGWVWAGKYKLERYLYLIHRLTGLTLILAGLIYLAMTVIFQIQGQDIWDATLTLIHSRWFGIIVVIFIYHGLNGLRLSLQESGIALGQPALPVYPYQDSLRRKRLLTIVAVAVIIILTLVFLFIFFILGVW